MEIKVKFNNDEVKELYLKASDGKSVFPFKTYASDFCYDVVATSCKEVAPNVYKYGIGLAFQIERDNAEERRLSNELGLPHANLSIDMRPRSSVWKTGMVLSNCEGTIDETYTGEVSAVFYHLFPDMPIYKVGDRIGQIKIGATLPIQFVEVDALNKTERADGGYGSTGK